VDILQTGTRQSGVGGTHIIRLGKKGLKNKVVAETIGISVYHVSRLWQGYLKEGEKAIRLDTRGRRLLEERTLSDDQERELQRFITDKTPNQLKFPFMDERCRA
jgi:hypothetical protein